MFFLLFFRLASSQWLCNRSAQSWCQKLIRVRWEWRHETNARIVRTRFLHSWDTSTCRTRKGNVRVDVGTWECNTTKIGYRSAIGEAYRIPWQTLRYRARMSRDAVVERTIHILQFFVVVVLHLQVWLKAYHKWTISWFIKDSSMSSRCNIVYRSIHLSQILQ